MSDLRFRACFRRLGPGAAAAAAAGAAWGYEGEGEERPCWKRFGCEAACSDAKSRIVVAAAFFFFSGRTFTIVFIVY